MSDTLDIEKTFQAAVNQHRAGQLSAAAALYMQVILNDPDHLNAQVNLGASLIDLGRPAEAVRYLKHAVHLAPRDAEALNNLGNAWQKSGAPNEALDCFEQAQNCTPNNGAILSNFGRALIRNGEFERGLNILGQAIAADPDNDALKVIEALALPMIPNSTHQIARARARLEQKLSKLESAEITLHDPANEIGTTPFALCYQGLDDRDIQQRIAQFYLTACPDLAYTARHIQTGHSGAKIRIGFISAHLGSHTIGKLNRRLLTGLDKTKFETHIFCPGTDRRGQDDIIDEIAAQVDQIHFPAPLLADTRHVVAAQELDLLYYLDIGMEPLTYFLAFSRLAKIQCVTVGHPVTTGIPTIDYFISSALIEPPEAARHYSEKLVQLDSFFADYRLPEIPEPPKTAEDFGLNPSANLYLCPQSLFKFHPDFDAILAGILAADPAGEIVLIAGPQPHWSELLMARLGKSLGAAAARVTLLPRQSGADFHHLLACADVVLDTPHFSGGNSSYEALALGKAIVTLPGAFMRSRVTAGLYKLMNIDALTATNPADYIKIALKFGRDKAARLEIEARIKAAQTTIFETNSALRTHERFFLEVVELGRH